MVRLKMVGVKGINSGEKNIMWKGNKVGYLALHNWVRRHKLKPKLCEECGKVPPYDLANISGKYKREINDYKWICRRCHMKKDKRIIKKDKNGRFSTKGIILKDYQKEMKKRILNYIKHPTYVTQQELYYNFKLYKRTLKKYLNELEKEGKIIKKRLFRNTLLLKPNG